jgi:hypothetical protein
LNDLTSGGSLIFPLYLSPLKPLIVPSIPSELSYD